MHGMDDQRPIAAWVVLPCNSLPSPGVCLPLALTQHAAGRGLRWPGDHACVAALTFAWVARRRYLPRARRQVNIARGFEVGEGRTEEWLPRSPQLIAIPPSGWSSMGLISFRRPSAR